MLAEAALVAGELVGDEDVACELELEVEPVVVGVEDVAVSVVNVALPSTPMDATTDTAGLVSETETTAVPPADCLRCKCRCASSAFLYRSCPAWYFLTLTCTSSIFIGDLVLSVDDLAATSWRPWEKDPVC